MDKIPKENKMISKKIKKLRDEFKRYDIDGYVIPKNDVRSLVEKIELLISNEKMRLEMGLNGSQKVIDNYDQTLLILSVQLYFF